MQALRREISILRRVSADANIVQFYGAVLPDQGVSATNPAMLVMEYMAVSILSFSGHLLLRTWQLPTPPCWSTCQCVCIPSTLRPGETGPVHRATSLNQSKGRTPRKAWKNHQ